MNPEHKRYILENISKKTAAQIAADLGVRERNVKKIIRMEQGKGPLKRVVPQEEVPKAAHPVPEPPNTVIAVNKMVVLASIALIVILGFAVYANSLNGKFVYDDENLVTDNSFIKGKSFLSKVFTEDIGKAAGIAYTFYRPLQIITYAIDYRLWKLNAMGYHLTNIILHILTALCVWRLINILFNDKTLPILTAILFVTHPIHTTVVSYISTRAESLYLLFMLISFIFYIKSLKSGRASYYLIMLSSYSLSLLSKENALILPALILLYHYAFKEKIRIKEFLSVSGLALLYIVLRLTVLKHLMVGLAHKSSLFERIPGLFVAFASYLRLLFLPFGLHIEYGQKLFSPLDPAAIAGLVILAGLIFCIIRTQKTNRLIFFSISWFLITLLPVSNLYQINAYMSENWLYLPSIGFFLILGNSLARFYKKGKFRASILIFTSCLLLFYSYLTFRQNKTWIDPVLFYERTLRYEPNSPNVLVNLGTAYDNAGKRDEAVKVFTKAIKIDSNLAGAYNNLGIVYNKMGKKEDAAGMFTKAIELNPNDAKIYANLGGVYDDMGRREEAVAMFKRAMAINPDQVAGYGSLGIAYAKMGRSEEAIAMLNKAIELNPNDANAYYNLGVLQEDTEKTEEAVSMYSKAIELNPNYADAYNNLGNIYTKMGKKEDAISLYKKAIDADPNYAKAYNNIGFAYYEMGKKEDAIPFYKKAVEVNPSYADAYNNLGAAYYEIGRKEDAVAAFRKAVEINPDHADARRNLEAITKEPK